MRQTLRSTAARIRQELPSLGRVARRAETSLADALEGGDDRFVDAAALNLHVFYSGVEHLFELVARRVDGTVPDGPGWHIDLLAQMAAPLDEVRPAVISTDVQVRLDRFQGFRHVVRNVYTFNLDIDQIQLLVNELPILMRHLEPELQAFADFLDAAARAD